MTASRPPHRAHADLIVPVSEYATTIPANPPGRLPVIDRDSATARLCAALEKIELPPTGPFDPQEAFAALAAGADIDAQDSRGCSLLMYAIRYGQTEIVGRLLLGCADPNRADARGLTPLMIAADCGATTALSYLLGHGAAVDACCPDGFNIGATALTMALRNRRTDLVKTLLDRGANPNGPARSKAEKVIRSPLTWAVLTDSIAALDLLLARGANPNMPPDADGITPLRATIRASTIAGPRCVRALIRHGADPASAAPFGCTLPRYFERAHRVDLLEALDDVLTEPSCAAARHRLLARLDAAQRHRWLPRSTAAEATSAIHNHWNRQP